MKKRKDKVHIITDSDLKRIKKQISEQTSEMAILMFLAWLKDEGRIDNDPQKLVEEYKHFEAWCDAITDHIVSLDQVRKIIEDATGTELHITNGHKTECIQEEEDENGHKD